jgi:alpha-galactosidase
MKIVLVGAGSAQLGFGMLGDTRYEESAVNLPNAELIPDLPGFVAVEVPAIVGTGGLEGHRFASYPKAFGALLVNPVVDTCAKVDEMVALLVERQRPWLDWLG